MKLQDLFSVKKPMIALLHLLPLPGDPDYDKAGGMHKVVETAKEELSALQEGGVDGVLISNEFSLPYQYKVPHVITASMAAVIGELKKDVLSIPFGVNVISDSAACVDLAAAVEAKFIRNLLTGVYVGELGVRSTDIATIARRKVELNIKDLFMFYMINAEADAEVAARPLSTVIKSLLFKCSPDAMCISGVSAGNAADFDMIREACKYAKDVPVICNTGCNKDNVKEVMSLCDGAFVGTAFKKDGKFENRVDYNRVKEFMDIVRECRAAL